MVRMVLLIGLLISPLATAQQFRVLVFTKTSGWHHESILEGVNGLRALATRHHFDLEWHEDATRFNDDNLKKFDVVVFLLTSGDVLNGEQQQAMERFIRSGKGFVGVHSAADTEYGWPWYTQLVGRSFYVHPRIQTARLNVLDNHFPGLEGAPPSFLWTDEWYQFGKENVQSLQYLLAVDETSYHPEVKSEAISTGGMGKFHPVAWHHEFDGGRSFYTALGHLPGIYQNPLFLEHLYGGLYWSATGSGKRAH